MNRTDFYFDSRDNESKIHAIKWVPDTDPVGILVLVHGMAEHLGRYEHFAKYMCDRGFVVAGNEHLGHGGSVGSNPKGYFCKRDPATVVVRDVHRLKKTVQAEYPGLPIFLFGHSMGSLIARNYLTRYGTGINGAIICGTLMMPKGLLGAMGFSWSQFVRFFVRSWKTLCPSFVASARQPQFGVSPSRWTDIS